MRNDGGQPADLSTRGFAAPATLAPLLIALAFVVFLGVRGGSLNAAPVTPPAAVALAPAGEAIAVGSATANPREGEAPRTAGAPEVSSAGQTSSAARGGPIVRVRDGEAVEILDAPDGDLVAKQGDETEFGSPSVFSVQRETRGWVGVSTPLLANDELGWIRVDESVLRHGYVDHAVIVDLSERSAGLYRGGEEVRSWPVTVGAGNSTTPTGTFAITDTFRGGLSPAYGCCAVTLSATQPNLPPDWPGGDRIAFHGTGGPLGVAASFGCIRSDDRDVIALLRTAPLGTPVTIRR